MKEEQSKARKETGQVARDYDEDGRQSNEWEMKSKKIKE